MLAGWSAALLTLLVGTVALWQLNATFETARTAERIETTLDTLEDVLSRLKDAETGQRGYVLTGDTAYLRPFRDALSGLDADLQALRTLTERQPAALARVDSLAPLIRRRLGEIDTTIALRRERGFNVAVEVIRTNAGKRSMDSVRSAIARIVAIERSRAAGARQERTKSARGAVTVIVIGTLSAFVLALIAQAFVQNASSHLRRAAAELATTNLELEEKTRAANAASQAKSDFLDVMSHELRTPLNAVLGHASLMAEGLGGPLTPQQSTALGRIQKSARNLVEMIDEILTYARLGRGTERVDRTQVDLCDVVLEVVDLAQHIFDAKGITLQFERLSESCLVETDVQRVKRILLNLLTNAAKFTFKGDATVSLTHGANSVGIQVRDTGIGIEPNNQRRIFDPFVQADRAKTRRADGAGLGLTNARHLARLLGGDLTVVSDVGRGSTFTLHLPATRSEATLPASTVPIR